MQTLQEIIERYPSSDKGSNYHNYLPFYEKHISKFRSNLTNLFEIGIYQGDSIRMWREYFPSGNLLAIDIVDMSHIVLDNTQLHVCDQSDRDQLSDLIQKTYKSFDIIIDDGGHMMHQQQISLGYLFPYLASGGVFVIEDLHTSGNSGYTRRGDTETLWMLEHYVNTGDIVSNCMTGEEISYLLDNIQSVTIEQGNVSPIAFITKK